MWCGVCVCVGWHNSWFPRINDIFLTPTSCSTQGAQERPTATLLRLLVTASIGVWRRIYATPTLIPDWHCHCQVLSGAILIFEQECGLSLFAWRRVVIGTKKRFYTCYGLRSFVLHNETLLSHSSQMTWRNELNKHWLYKCQNAEVANGSSVQRVVAQPPLLGNSLSKANNSRQRYRHSYEKLL